MGIRLGKLGKLCNKTSLWQNGGRLGKLGKLGNMTSIWQNGSRQVDEAKIVEGREHVALCGPAGSLDQIGKVLLIRARC